MRLHISLPDELVAELDRRAGTRGRSAFIVGAIREALDDERRWELIESAIGSIPDTGHEWDDDPAAWVREQRFADPRRVG
jgi:Arc/MetJ family transcription regulator